MPRGIFVTYWNFLEGRHGGVQLCTKEYVNVIKATGVDLDFCAFESDRRLSTRLLRQLNSSPYFRPAEPSLIGRFAQLADKVQPDYVFLNQVSLAVYASAFRRVVPQSCKIVVLSHGLESTDLLHLIRLRHKLPLSGRIRPAPDMALGKILLDENALRADIDLVCALSPLDVVLVFLTDPSRIGGGWAEWSDAADPAGAVWLVADKDSRDALLQAVRKASGGKWADDKFIATQGGQVAVRFVKQKDTRPPWKR